MELEKDHLDQLNKQIQYLVNQYPIFTPPTPINTNDASALTYPLFNDTSKVTSS